jgi:hypothetical protein
VKDFFLHLTSWLANYANIFNNRLTDGGSACFWPLKPKTRARRAHIAYRFCMAALGGVSGDLLCSRSQEFRSSLDPYKVFGPSLSYSTPLKRPGRGVSQPFWAFCAGLICGNVRRLLHIYEGSLGRIGNNTAPSSSDVLIPMGSKRFAPLQTGHRVRASLAQNRISALGVSERPKSISSAPKNLSYIAITPNPPHTPGVLEGGATKGGGARAREFRDSLGASKPGLGAL